MYSINDKIKQIHLSNKLEYEFEKIDLFSDSYYLDFSVSLHMNSSVMEYDSEDLKTMKNNLQKLWEKDEKKQKYVSIVMAALTHKLLDESEMPKMDLYNYML